jgi:hypothetical protein
VGVLGGSGGVGRQWFDGNYYAGGGGAAFALGGPTQPGGAGGGGNGFTGGNPAIGNGAVNTGGGGGGFNGVPLVPVETNAATGGSGIAIVRYPGPLQIATGGVVVVSGGYIYHYFYTSGTFTL